MISSCVSLLADVCCAAIQSTASKSVVLTSVPNPSHNHSTLNTVPNPSHNHSTLNTGTLNVRHVAFLNPSV